MKRGVNMKNNLLKILMPSVLVIAIAGVFIVNNISGSGKMSNWGKWLSDNKEDNTSSKDYYISKEGRLSKRTVNKDEIYEIGNDIIITKRK